MLMSCLHNRLVNNQTFPSPLWKFNATSPKAIKTAGMIRLWGNNHLKGTKDLHSASYMIDPSMFSFPTSMQLGSPKQKLTLHGIPGTETKWYKKSSIPKIMPTSQQEGFSSQALLPKYFSCFGFELVIDFFLFNRQHAVHMIQEDMMYIKLFTWGKFCGYCSEGRLNKPLMNLTSLEPFTLGTCLHCEIKALLPLSRSCLSSQWVPCYPLHPCDAVSKPV